MAQAGAVKKSSYAEQLGQELDALANAQVESPEFRQFLAVKLTLPRAQFEAGQMRHYVMNRRDCWGFVQGKAPFEVKKLIWKHEEDELIADARAGVDHVELATKEAQVLGLSKEELEAAQPTPSAQAALYGWLYLAQNLPWLGAITSSHFLERRNNNAIMKGGGMSERWRRKMVEELKIDKSLLINANVHVEADEGHSDFIWDCIAAHVNDQQSFDAALYGAQQCAIVDRAFRVEMARGMAAIPD